MRTLCIAVAAVAALASVAAAEDWPQFRGLNRDGISAEKGLLQAWPEGGPKVVWNSEIGIGWSSVAVVKGTVYATGIVGDEVALTAIDASGKTLWQQKVDKATGGGGHRGTRGTPTVDGDYIYLVTDAGNALCLKKSDGTKVWSVSFREKYGAKPPQWVFAESPLVDGERVIVAPGGSAALAALNKKTGEQVWSTEAVDAKTGYASARIMEFGGVRQIISFSEKNIFSSNAADGKLLWKLPQENKYFVNATSVVFKDNLVFAACNYGYGCQGIKLTAKDGGVTAEQAWYKKALDDHFGGVILMDGKVYGTGSNFRGLTCVDLATGEVGYANKAVGKSSNIFANGRMYCQGEDGTVRLVDLKDGSVKGTFTIEIQVKGKMWAHPAISDGKLYIHHDGTLTAYDIRAPK